MGWVEARTLALVALALAGCELAFPLDDPPDFDTDGVPDSNDNCAKHKNPEQHDEDGDMIGNACDNCPEVANQDQADTEVDPDTIGDACDPFPCEPDDVRVLFEPFEDPAAVATWFREGGRTWTVINGEARPDTVAALNALVAPVALDRTAWVRVSSHAVDRETATAGAGAGVVVWATMDDGESALRCQTTRRAADSVLVVWSGGVLQSQAPTIPIDGSYALSVSTVFALPDLAAGCRAGTITDAITITVNHPTGTHPGVLAENRAVEFRYLVAYSRPSFPGGTACPTQ